MPITFPASCATLMTTPPVPTWEQVTRNGEPGMAGQMRLVACGQEEKAAIGGLEHLVVQMQAALLF